MAETVYINISAPALAFLLYENLKVTHEQEGFLLGDTNLIVKKTITDTESHNVKVQKIVNVNAVVPCPRTCLVYDNVGAINKAKIKELLGTQIKNVVAWYKYENHNKFKLTMRGKIVHKELSKFFDIPQELFSCCLLYSSHSSIKSTHTYTHHFLRFHNKRFETVPLHIDNLGEPCNSYKPNAPASELFQKMYQSLGIQKKKTSDWGLIGDIQDKLNTEVRKTVAQLYKSEQIKGQLEREVEQLRRRIEFEKEEKINKEVQHTKNNESFISEFVFLVNDDTGKLPENISTIKLCQELVIKNMNHEKSNQKQSAVMNKHKNVSTIASQFEVTRIQRTDEDEDVVVDANCGQLSGISSDNNLNNVNNLIDLTLSEEEDSAETPRIKNNTQKKLSYAQAMSTSKTKNSNT